jgi:hypothetical protein
MPHNVVRAIGAVAAKFFRVEKVFLSANIHVACVDEIAELPGGRTITAPSPCMAVDLRCMKRASIGDRANTRMRVFSLA